MTPQEISQLKQQSPALQEALTLHRADVWPFLRYRVERRYDYSSLDECEQCKKPFYPTLISPYNAPHPGWCIDCVLNAFFDPDAPLYRSPEEIEEQHRLDNPVICEVFDFDEEEPEGGWIIPPIG